MADKIFVALSTFAEYGDDPLNILKESAIPFELNPLGRRLVREEIIELAADATGIIAGVEPYDRPVLENLPNLRCISRCGVGVDNIEAPVAEQRGVAIRNTPDVVIQPVAEIALAMIFDLMRKLTFHTALLKSRRWEKAAGNLLVDKTVGIMGLGRIGKRLAEMLGALGVRVIGTDLNPDTAWAEKTGVEYVSENELLRQADILSLHLSVIAGNEFTLDSGRIASMKPGAWVINVGRGSLVDDGALAGALASGQLSGAGLDVFENEPYDGPLCDLDNVVMTPHVSTLTVESRVQMELEAAQNLVNSLSGNDA